MRIKFHTDNLGTAKGFIAKWEEGIYSFVYTVPISSEFLLDFNMREILYPQSSKVIEKHRSQNLNNPHPHLQFQITMRF